MGESEKESVVSSVCLWLLMSTFLSLSSGCCSSLSRPWKLWPLQRGWGQIRLSRSHHGPACSEGPAPFRFHQLLLCSSSPALFPCLPPFFFSFAHFVCFFLSVASSCRPCCWSLLCLSQFCSWLVTKVGSNPTCLHVWYLSITRYH